MNLILGGRASADLIRTGCNEARVEALFSFPENRFLGEMLEELGFPFEGELLIKRSIYREGRNKIFINGSMATLQNLARLGTHLISISGQHEHQLLLRPENHLYVLDDFAGLSEARSSLGELYGRYQEVQEEIARLQREIRESEERRDLHRFQIQEIEQAAVKPGEDEALLEEKRRLQHAEELLEIVTEAYQSLYEREDSVSAAVSQCAKRIEKGAGIDPNLSGVRDSLSEVEVKLEDAAFSLRDFQRSIDMDPQRLEAVGERLDLLNRLKRKYGPTLEDVEAYREKLASAMEDMEGRREHLEQLKDKAKDLAVELAERASRLSERRRKAAGELAAAVERELEKLHMADTRFEVAFDPEALDPEAIDTGEIRSEGIDRVEFMMAPNVGEDLRPLSRIASGGELSRMMLALKSILARSGSVETVIFDEVDTGISGATAEVIGEKLLSLAHYHQILCITHLPQIATQGGTHFLVRKEVVGERTQTAISELDPEGRVQEIARLLGGREISPSALEHARAMLG